MHKPWHLNRKQFWLSTYSSFNEKSDDGKYLTQLQSFLYNKDTDISVTHEISLANLHTPSSMHIK